MSAIKVCTTLPDDTEICTTVDTGDARIRSYTEVVGNGSATVFTLAHGLGTKDLSTIVRNVATGELSGSDAFTIATTDDEATITFPTSPTTGQYSVTLLGVLPSEDDE